METNTANAARQPGIRESSWAKSAHSSSRRYGRFAYDSKSLVVAEISRCLIWLSIASSGPAISCNGTHTLRRTKATLIYRRTKNLRAVQLLLGYTKLEST